MKNYEMAFIVEFDRKMRRWNWSKVYRKVKAKYSKNNYESICYIKTI